MSDRGLGEKPLAQWTMTSRSRNPTTTKEGAYGYSSEIVSLSSGRSSKPGLFSRFKKGPRTKCTLPSRHKHGWKSETMKAPVLLTFAAVSLLLAILLEVLAYQSQKVGGLSLVKDADALSSTAKFGYLYLPTIIAVIYSLAWTWVDLDVKRMQPWLELSRQEGVTGRNSLFLDYPFECVAFVPMRAAKRKHWAVFYSGTIMVLILYLITPLQSAVLGTGEILLRKPVAISASTKLMDPLAQAARLDQAVLNTGYSITWLNQPYPPFTTAEYALLPFRPETDTSNIEQPANWTGVTTKYWTELKCWPVEGLPAWKNGPLTFFDGKKCNTSKIVVQTALKGVAPYKMQYIGYQNDAWADNILASPTCDKAAWNEFLAIWAYYDEPNDKFDVTASFCETSYFQQSVRVSVRTSDLRPISASIKPLGESMSLPVSDFNSSAFQFLLGTGVVSQKTPRDYPFTHLIEQGPRLNGTGLTFPLSPMTGFAFGGQSYTVPDYKNHTVMDSAYRAAHQSLFSVAMHYVFVNGTGVNQTNGEAVYPRYGIIVSRPFAIALEASLVVVVLLVSMLFWICSQCDCMLAEDPGSLGSLMNLVKDSHELLSEFNGQDTLTDEQLAHTLSDRKFVLSCGCLNGTDTTAIQILEDPSQKSKSQKQTSPYQAQPAVSGHYSPIHPLVLNRGIGFLFLLCLCAAIAVLSVLKAREGILGGLTPPSTSFEVNLILTSFLPTAFSTVVEPFWVLLNRLLCILQPFHDLWKEPKAADQSLRTRYTAVPPQLAIWRAAKSGHYLLVGLCVVAMLANVLAVGLGGLFNEAPKQVQNDLKFAPIKDAMFSDPGIDRFRNSIYFALGAYYEDPYYIAMANLTSGTSFPPWTDNEYFYLPLDIANSSSAGGIYTATTTGIGIEPSCLPVNAMVSDNEPPGLPTTSRDGGEREGCPPIYYPSSLLMNTSRYDIPEGSASAEIIDTPSGEWNVTDCNVALVVGWSHSFIKNETGTMNTSMVVCRPTIKAAQFSVSFDARGYILNSTLTNNSTSLPSYSAFPYHEMALINSLNNKFRDRQLPWHNDTISRDWFHYLLKVQSGDQDILSPLAPLPDPSTMIPSVAYVYKMMFALFISLNQYLIVDGDRKSLVSVSQSITETRIFVSTSAFIVSISILGLNVIMAIMFYGWGFKSFLPRMPTTIGSLLAYIAPSKAVREFSSQGVGRSRTFGFGRYVGDDGHAHIGIDYSEKVVPLKLSSLERGDTVPSTSKFLKLLHRPSAKRQGDTWL